MHSKALGPKRNHHYNPKHYLRGFTESEGSKFLWVYRRAMPFDQGRNQGRNPRRSSITKVGVARDFYAVPNFEDGSVDYEQYENRLQRQELIGVEALRALRAKQPVDLKMKVALSFYLDLMLKRVPPRFQHAAPMVATALSDFPWDLLARKAADDGRFDLAIRLTRDRRAVQQILERRILLESMARRSTTIITALASMTWTLFIAPRRWIVLTTDNPVFFPRDIGLTKTGRSFLVFPVSSELLLFASWAQGQDGAYVKASPTQIVHLNRLTLRGADQIVYSKAPLRRVVKDWDTILDPNSARPLTLP